MHVGRTMQCPATATNTAIVLSLTALALSAAPRTARGQLHFFLDDLFPRTMARPLLGSGA
jgi:hypothetical protein